MSLASRAAAAAVLCAAAFATVAAAGPLDLSKMLDAPVKENLYPDPIDSQLARVRDPVDRVLVAFRAAEEQRLRALSGDGTAKFLSDALAEHHRQVAWSFTRELATSEGATSELAGALASLPLPADAAAYAPVLDRLPAALAPQFAADRQRAAAAVAGLQDRAALEAYVRDAAATSGFFRKARLWTRAARAVTQGVDALVERLEDRFSAERLIRFFDRVARGPLPRTAAHAADALASLRARLTSSCVQELSDRVAGGLSGATQSVDLLENGALRVSTTLQPPRLRQVSNYVQALADPAQRALFLPVFQEVDRWCTGQLAGAGGRAPDSTATSYLTRVHDSLENMVRWIRLATRPVAAPADESWEDVRAALKDSDPEGLFADL